MKNKRGLSAVITTLLIILLVIVAVGIVWVVVRNVIEEGVETLDLGTKCLAVDLRAISVSVDVVDADTYAVTLTRSPGGETISGVKINLFNSTDNSGIINFGVTVGEFDTVTQNLADTGIENASRMEFTAFFTDASGNEQLCSQIKTFNF